MAQRLKYLPAKQETRVHSLGQEDFLEEEMETRSSILAWKIPWTEEPGGLQSTGLQRVRLPFLRRSELSCFYDRRYFSNNEQGTSQEVP